MSKSHQQPFVSLHGLLAHINFMHCTPYCVLIHGILIQYATHWVSCSKTCCQHEQAASTLPPSPPGHCISSCKLLMLMAFSDHVQEEIKLKQQLVDPLNDLQETAEKIAAVSAECKLEMDAQEYMESFKPTLMDIIDKWSKVSLAAEIKSASQLFLSLLKAAQEHMSFPKFTLTDDIDLDIIGW